ncbi:MAG TPA: hypothetical protein VMC78_11995 [Mycobacterium sp.]|nr:hypothetical protein [Mycobacterium sp.]
MSRKYQVQTGDVLSKIGAAVLRRRISAGFSGPAPDQSGFAEGYVCVNGYLEASPAA